MYIHTNHMVQTASRMYCLIGFFDISCNIVYIILYLFIILYNILLNHQPLHQRFSETLKLHKQATPRHQTTPGPNHQRSQWPWRDPVEARQSWDSMTLTTTGPLMVPYGTAELRQKHSTRHWRSSLRYSDIIWYYQIFIWYSEIFWKWKGYEWRIPLTPLFFSSFAGGRTNSGTRAPTICQRDPQQSSHCKL